MGSIVTIVPSASPGSKGDEGMMLGLLHILQNNGIRGARIITPEISALSWVDTLAANTPVEISETSCELTDLVQTADVDEDLFLVGADVMDGSSGFEPAYARVRTAANRSKLGKKTTVISASFRSDVSSELLKIINEDRITRYFLRDTWSQRNFNATTGVEGLYLPDCAFAVRAVPSNVTNHLARLIRYDKERGRTIVGLNFGIHGLVHGLKATTLDEQREVIGLLCNSICARTQPTTVVLIPHDARTWPGMPNDEFFCKIAADILASKGAHVIGGDARISYPEIVHLSKYFDFAISCRMHFAIACAQNCIPAIVFRSNEKLRGFYSDYYGEDWEMLSPQSPKQLDAKIATLQSSQQKLRERMASSMARVRAEMLGFRN